MVVFAMLMHVAIALHEPEKQRAFLEVLAEAAPDATRFGISIDKESGHLLLHGESEPALEALIDAARAANAPAFRVGAPQVNYRETLTAPVTIDHTYRRVSGGAGQFARVLIAFTPLPPGSGFVFESTVVGGSLTEDFIAAVEQGLSTEKESGLLAGFPVTDFKASLIDGAYHEVDSTAAVFQTAAHEAFRKLGTMGVVVLLEPVMTVKVVTPYDYVGGVIGDLKSRRGQIQEELVEDDEIAIVTAIVPLANMFGHANFLRAICEGRASVEMRFLRLERALSPDDDPPFGPAAAMRA
jgi:elongation factor G